MIDDSRESLKIFHDTNDVEVFFVSGSAAQGLLHTILAGILLRRLPFLLLTL